jgi:cell division protein FtsB
MADRQALGRVHLTKRLLLTVGIVVACLIALVGLPGFSSLVETRDKVRSLRAETAKVRQQNDVLRAKARSLREDPAAIEDVARRELGLARPGEVVFIIKDVPQAGHAPLPKR